MDNKHTHKKTPDQPQTNPSIKQNQTSYLTPTHSGAMHAERTQCPRTWDLESATRTGILQYCNLGFKLPNTLLMAKLYSASKSYYNMIF